jgi:hypothetical protein
MTLYRHILEDFSYCAYSDEYYVGFSFSKQLFKSAEGKIPMNICELLEKYVYNNSDGEDFLKEHLLEYADELQGVKS